jgi:phage terminase large subunit-like protein
MSLTASPLTWTPHPVLPIPTQEQILALARQQGPQEAARIVSEMHAKREQAIRDERADPLNFGFEPESWKRTRQLIDTYEKVFISGGNREGKSTFVAKYAVEYLVKNPDSEWFFFHSSEKSSIDQQQNLVYSYLPPEWRDLGKPDGKIYVKHSEATGFSNFKFILPNGSKGMFFNYGQDTDVLEGYEPDGVWFDELVPLEFLTTLRYRRARGKRLRLLVTFTPVRGYNAVVGEFLKGARVVESRRADIFPEGKELVDKAYGCPPGHMPYVMEGDAGRSAAIFHHNGMNPYGAGAEVRREAAGENDEQKKIRLYGWASKPAGAALSKFSEAHIITRAKFDEIAKRGGTRYCVTDPAGVKNWFIKWYFFTPDGRCIVYREWPDRKRYDWWAEQPGDNGKGVNRYNWTPGPAQDRADVTGIVGYKRMILEAEGWVWDEKSRRWDGSKSEKILARLIDPRGGGTDSLVAEDAVTITEMMEEEHRDGKGTIIAPSMVWDAAPGGGKVDLDLQLLDEWMDYDPSQPVSIMNQPRWFVVEDCEQSILAYREFTGLGSDKDALKDIIDPDRYMVKSGYGHVSESSMRPRGGCYY